MSVCDEHSYTAVYVGGPRHGEVECCEGAPPRVVWFPTFNGRTGQRGEVGYERRELADTPGRIVYSVTRDADS